MSDHNYETIATDMWATEAGDIPLREVLTREELTSYKPASRDLLAPRSEFRQPRFGWSRLLCAISGTDWSCVVSDGSEARQRWVGLMILTAALMAGGSAALLMWELGQAPSTSIAAGVLFGAATAAVDRTIVSMPRSKISGSMGRVVPAIALAGLLAWVTSTMVLLSVFSVDIDERSRDVAVEAASSATSVVTDVELRILSDVASGLQNNTAELELAIEQAEFEYFRLREQLLTEINGGSGGQSTREPGSGSVAELLRAESEDALARLDELNDALWAARAEERSVVNELTRTELDAVREIQDRAVLAAPTLLQRMDALDSLSADVREVRLVQGLVALVVFSTSIAPSLVLLLSPSSHDLLRREREELLGRVIARRRRIETELQEQIELIELYAQQGRDLERLGLLPEVGELVFGHHEEKGPASA